MSSRNPITIACIAATFATSATAQVGSPTVKTDAGIVSGTAGAAVVSFKGIPYAAPPVGRLRWRAPQPVRAWRGVRAADRVGALCQQKYQAQDNGVGPLPMSEDCLTLNVFAPKRAKNTPVMFWIHGGGFVNGSGTAALYDGSELARQGVVVVTINYRLGRFGFFAHPALTAAAGREPTGNYALMDMVAALKWVRANISRFGGDPRQVTIFGESAGGVAVNALMVSSASRGLFARAMVESGLGRETVLPLSEAEKNGESFAEKVGHKGAPLDELRSLPAEQILNAGDPDLLSGGTMMIDGKVMTASPMAGFGSGKEAPVPYVVGWNSLEFPVPAAAVAARFGSSSGLTPARLAEIKSAYPDAVSYDRNLLSDLIFVEPAVALARLHAAHGHPTWAYQFSVVPKAAQPKLQGAPHASERQYVFRTLAASPFPTDANDTAQARAMSAYWAAFGTTGNPNGGGRVQWYPIDGNAQRVLDFTNDGPRVTEIPRRAALSAISAVYPLGGAISKGATP